MIRLNLPSIVAAGIASFTTLTHAATAVPWNANGVEWLYYYNPNQNPDSAIYDKEPNKVQTPEQAGTFPLWDFISYSGVNTEVRLDPNFLTISTPDADGSAALMQTQGYSLGAGGSVFTMEARFRVDSVRSGAFYAGHFLFSTDGANPRWNEILFSESSIGNVTGLDLTEWTTVRFTITGGDTASPEVLIYINNSSVASGSVSLMHTSGGSSYFQFGDASVGEMAGGTVEYDYIRWTDAGAFAPIPEPSIFAGLSAAAILLFAAKRRNRTSI